MWKWCVSLKRNYLLCNYIVTIIIIIIIIII